MLLVVSFALAACPPIPDVAAAVLTPDGAAHVLSVGPDAACWWRVSDTGDARVQRQFDLAQQRPTALTWDGESGCVRIRVVDAQGQVRDRLFRYEDVR